MVEAQEAPLHVVGGARHAGRVELGLHPVDPPARQERHERPGALAVPELQDRRVPRGEGVPARGRLVLLPHLAQVAPVHGEAPCVVDRGLGRGHAPHEVARAVLEHGRGLPDRDALAAAGSSGPRAARAARPASTAAEQAPGDPGPQALGLPRRRHELGRRRLARRDGRLERVAAGQHRGDDERRGGAAPRLLLEAGEDRPLDRGVETGHEGRRLDRPLVAVLAHELGQGLALEGAAARVELVQHEAEGVDVAADADLAALQLLRRHVARRPRAHVLLAERLGEAGQAEVGDAHVALAVEHEVRGLEVPVQHALLVRGGEPGAELSRDVEGLVGRQTADAPQERREVLAVHQLHGQEEVALRLPHVVHAADRRVGDLPGHPDLAVEPGEPLAVRVEAVGKELEGDRLVELQVVGPVDLAHPAAAEEPGDAVAPRQDRPGHEPLAARAPRTRSRGFAPGPAKASARRSPGAGGGAGRAVGDVQAGPAGRTRPVGRAQRCRAAWTGEGHLRDSTVWIRRSERKKCRPGRGIASAAGKECRPAAGVRS